MTMLEALFARMSWALLEHRCRYYVLAEPTVDDHEYDRLEREYEALAARLGREPYASNMVGFDLKRPSCWRVYLKLTGRLGDALDRGDAVRARSPLAGAE